MATIISNKALHAKERQTLKLQGSFEGGEATNCLQANTDSDEGHQAIESRQVRQRAQAATMEHANHDEYLYPTNHDLGYEDPSSAYAAYHASEYVQYQQQQEYYCGDSSAAYYDGDSNSSGWFLDANDILYYVDSRGTEYYPDLDLTVQDANTYGIPYVHDEEGRVYFADEELSQDVTAQFANIDRYGDLPQGCVVSTDATYYYYGDDDALRYEEEPAVVNAAVNRSYSSDSLATADTEMSETDGSNFSNMSQSAHDSILTAPNHARRRHMKDGSGVIEGTASKPSKGKKKKKGKKQAAAADKYSNLHSSLNNLHSSVAISKSEAPVSQWDIDLDDSDKTQKQRGSTSKEERYSNLHDSLIGRDESSRQKLDQDGSERTPKPKHKHKKKIKRSLSGKPERGSSTMSPLRRQKTSPPERSHHAKPQPLLSRQSTAPEERGSMPMRKQTSMRNLQQQGYSRRNLLEREASYRQNGRSQPQRAPRRTMPRAMSQRVLGSSSQDIPSARPPRTRGTSRPTMDGSGGRRGAYGRSRADRISKRNLMRESYAAAILHHQKKEESLLEMLQQPTAERTFEDVRNSQKSEEPMQDRSFRFGRLAKQASSSNGLGFATSFRVGAQGTQQAARQGMLGLAHLATSVAKTAVNTTVHTAATTAKVGLATTQMAAGATMMVGKTAANVGLATTQVAANTTMMVGQKAAGATIMVGKTAANVGLATTQVAANTTMMVGKTAANVGLATTQAAANTTMMVGKKTASITVGAATMAVDSVGNLVVNGTVGAAHTAVNATKSATAAVGTITGPVMGGASIKLRESLRNSSRKQQSYKYVLGEGKADDLASSVFLSPARTEEETEDAKALPPKPATPMIATASKTSEEAPPQTQARTMAATMA